MGIGIYNNTIAAPAKFTINNNFVNAGENMYVDEVYFTNSASDFIAIPEPAAAYLIGVVLLYGVTRRRRAA